MENIGGQLNQILLKGRKSKFYNMKVNGGEFETKVERFGNTDYKKSRKFLCNKFESRVRISRETSNKSYFAKFLEYNWII